MPSDRIIKPGDVIENISASLRSSFVILMMNPFAFQGAEEAFHDSIVVAVADAAHADATLQERQAVLVGHTGVLTTLVRVVD